MEDMWNHPVVRKEWIKSKQEPGKVLMARDEKNRPYLSRAELKAVADIILFKYLQTKKMKSTILCAISEVVSMRFLHGVGERPGIMGISYSTAYWIYMQLGYRAYKLESPEDLYNPFVSMYFGAAYVTWLSEYEERERTPEFVVQAYCVGPQNVNPQDTNTLWLKFEEALSSYQDRKGFTLVNTFDMPNSLCFYWNKFLKLLVNPSKLVLEELQLQFVLQRKLLPEQYRLCNASVNTMVVLAATYAQSNKNLDMNLRSYNTLFAVYIPIFAILSLRLEKLF
nr:uncharacterized protein LOC112704057 [Arachis hypogaea]